MARLRRIRVRWFVLAIVVVAVALIAAAPPGERIIVRSTSGFEVTVVDRTGLVHDARIVAPTTEDREGLISVRNPAIRPEVLRVAFDTGRCYEPPEDAILTVIRAGDRLELSVLRPWQLGECNEQMAVRRAVELVLRAAVPADLVDTVLRDDPKRPR